MYIQCILTINSRKLSIHIENILNTLYRFIKINYNMHNRFKI